MARFCRPTTDTPAANARVRNREGSITGFVARRSQKKNSTTHDRAQARHHEALRAQPDHREAETHAEERAPQQIEARHRALGLLRARPREKRRHQHRRRVDREQRRPPEPPDDLAADERTDGRGKAHDRSERAERLRLRVGGRP